MVKLKWLKIEKLYDVEKTELHFHDRRNVLLGKNGSGKTTLLKVVSMILRGDLSELAGTEFDIAFRLDMGEGRTIDAHFQNKKAQSNSPPTPETLGPGTGRAAFTASSDVRVTLLPKMGPTVIRTEGSAMTVHHSGTPTEEPPLNMLHSVHPHYLVNAWTIATRGFPGPYSWTTSRMDEGLDYARVVLGEHADHLEALFFNGSSIAFLPGGPASIKDALEGKKDIQVGDRLRLSSASDIPLLDVFTAATGFRKVEYLTEVIFKHENGLFPVHLGRPVLYCTRADGTTFDHTKLSYGQLRLWSFLFYLACNPDSVIADELVNGLHHEWIELCLHEVGDRQAFLTSQNPLLFDYLEFASAGDVKEQFVLCALDEADPKRRMRWTQMSDDEAARFFAAYQTGIQYVSETLRTEGFWVTARHELSLLILPEDSNPDAPPILEALLKKMLRLVDGECGTHRIEHLPANEQQRKALRQKAHRERSSKGDQHRRLLAGAIAAHLARGDLDGFAAYHEDGDRRWRDRGSPEADFPGFVALRGIALELLRNPPRPGAAPVDRSDRIDRFFLVAPYWELESWLYQNTRVAIALCNERDGGRHAALFATWAANRASLDDEEHTKELCCLTDKHNRALAEDGFPHKEVDAARASFAATVDRLRACPALVEALARTRSHPA